MYRKKIDVDVISDVLKAALSAYPDSVFIKSLSFQYEERGGLSKKQLEGLHKKALKVTTIPAGKLATLEAEILKRPTRFKSIIPPPKPVEAKDERPGQAIEAVLAKYPQHKRVLFFKSKYDNNDVLTPAELSELERFSKLAAKK